MKLDPLLHKERQAIADELTSSMRHDVRNRLSAIRNAAFYLKRRVSQLELWTSDARVQQFFALIDESVTHADTLLRARFAALPTDGMDAKATPVAGAIATAVEFARVAAGISFDVLVDDAELLVDADELALAVRCLLESAASCLGESGVVHLRGSSRPAGYLVEIRPWSESMAVVESDGPTAAERWEGGGEGLGVDIARRIARRHEGHLETAPSAGATCVRLTFPLASRQGAALAVERP